MNKKIGVIGAGVFGSEIAVQLAKKGFSVTLFEKEQDILSGGGTPNSVMRLHMGFHYPRSIETAVQSRIGFKQFLERFPDSVDLDFENYYAIAKNGSKTSPQAFEKFTEVSGIFASEIATDALGDYGVDTNLIAKAYTAKEGVICVETLRENLKEDLRAKNIEIRLSTPVDKIRKAGNSWRVEDEESNELGKFDFLIRSTYSTDSILMTNFEDPRPDLERHRTLTLELKSSLARIGLTVVDGDFLTLMPVAFSPNHLVYAPQPSVVSKTLGLTALPDLSASDAESVLISESKILQRLLEWFPALSNFQVQKRLLGLRSIEGNVSDTDRRISGVSQIAPGFVDVSSGKIDHCVELARNVEKQL